MSYQKAIALMDKGPSRPTLFSVRLPNGFVSQDTNDYLDFFCTTTAIPEIRHNSVKVAGHEYMGIVRDQPTAIIYAKPFTINVIADPDFRVYQDIRNWFDRTAQNANQTTGTTGRVQRMRYYNTFVRDMELIKLEQPGDANDFSSQREDKLKEVMKVNFLNAYPVAVGQVALNSEQVDSVTTFQVQFTYESYNISYDGLGAQDRPGFF
ncbi:hypothetical protein [Synechococcus phage S-N03]|uniref:Tail tube monomer n=1 Tax=Synechococcus phage S-N03 TaxID=2718943 RepID=A0A6G8R5Y2_9CAUD|nr:tail tube [Synechococcus phage S-N03]QIN96792.1 hypothetical protein [Synechococcus phage S-N03]